MKLRKSKSSRRKKKGKRQDDTSEQESDEQPEEDADQDKGNLPIVGAKREKPNIDWCHEFVDDYLQKVGDFKEKHLGTLFSWHTEHGLEGQDVEVTNHLNYL